MKLGNTRWLGHTGKPKSFVSFARLSLIFLGYFSPVLATAETRSQRADAILHRAMQDRKIPGMQAAVVIDGRIVFSRSYGVANLQTPVRVTSKTLFSINSITKAFTGIAVMEEVEKGRLNLSVPISTYLTDIPATWGRVNTLQLLGQISGLPDIDAYDDIDFSGIRDEKAAWAWALSQPASPPGEKRDYCQTNLRLVQLIINKLEGRDPDASLIDEELAKAHMVATAYGDSRDVIKNKSQPYRLGDNGEMRNHFERFGPMMRANSGLNTTADDMARWMISVLDGKQMSRESREVMWTLVSLNDGSRSSFALGWDREEHANYTSVGGVGGTRSAFSLYLGYNVGVVILTNLMGANPEELADELAASFVPGIKLSGVTKFRAEAEKTRYVNLATMLNTAKAQGASSSFDQEELESWIGRLLFSKKAQRALAIAKFDSELFPTSIRPLELTAEAEGASGQLGAETGIYRKILSRDPSNVTALAFFKSR
jgi:CubicO group peptidase (beta-lactamase class C family)